MGFVRSYCRVVGLDSGPIVDQLEFTSPHLSHQNQKLSLLTPLPAVRKRKIGMLLFPFLGLGLASCFGIFCPQPLGRSPIQNRSNAYRCPPPAIAVVETEDVSPHTLKGMALTGFLSGAPPPPLARRKLPEHMTSFSLAVLFVLRTGVR